MPSKAYNDQVVGFIGIKKYFNNEIQTAIY